MNQGDAGLRGGLGQVGGAVPVDPEGNPGFVFGLVDSGVGRRIDNHGGPGFPDDLPDRVGSVMSSPLRFKARIGWSS
jgi:hypothetical protein